MANKTFPKGTIEISQRILKAAENLEKTIIYGDADLDGIASVVILKELFEFLNPLYSQDESLIKVYFPNRETEGYGINFSALEFFKNEPPCLFFALDCGISNFEEIKEAKKLGFEVIIIDHHQILGKLPKADIIVNPKQKSDPYPFKEFAAAGLVYKVTEAVLAEKEHPSFVRDKLLELTALATLADLMPLAEDNRELVDKGMTAFLNTQRPGLLALIVLGDVDVQQDTEVFQKIIAPLNSGKLQEHISETYLLLVEGSEKKAKILAQKLIKLNRQKKDAISIALEEIGEKIDKQRNESLIIFENSKAWPVVSLGVMASKLLQRYRKPVFLFKMGEKESVCSSRLPKEMDGVAAMASCKKLLETYGGHAPACGCRLKNKNLPKFKKCLEKYFSKF